MHRTLWKESWLYAVVVKVVEKDEYNDWVLAKKEEAIKLAELTEKEWSLAELTQRGEGFTKRTVLLVTR